VRLQKSENWRSSERSFGQTNRTVLNDCAVGLASSLPAKKSSRICSSAFSANSCLFAMAQALIKLRCRRFRSARVVEKGSLSPQLLRLLLAHAAISDVFLIHVSFARSSVPLRIDSAFPNDGYCSIERVGTFRIKPYSPMMPCCNSRIAGPLLFCCTAFHRNCSARLASASVAATGSAHRGHHYQVCRLARLSSTVFYDATLPHAPCS
jgi:hypothetical protein